MFRRSIIAASALVVLSLGRAVAQSTDGWVGTWKLNIAQSKYSPGPPPKSGTVKISTPEGGGITIVADGIDAQGKPTHTENTAKFDGKDSRVKGAATPNTTRAFKRTDTHHMEFTTKVDGKPTTSTTVVVSLDGKIHILTTTGKNAQGQTVNNTVVYEKQ